MTQKNIEIEKKFLLKPRFTETLIQKGAILVSEREFSDSYYDFPDYKLCLQNCWLRCRSSIWELKYLEKSPEKPAVVDSYCELNDEQDILHVLSNYAPKIFKNIENMSEFVAAFDLQVFASFATTRTKYHLDGVIVDLDSACFGYSIGEIEIIVNSEEEIPNAEKKLETLAKKLGKSGNSAQNHS